MSQFYAKIIETAWNFISGEFKYRERKKDRSYLWLIQLQRHKRRLNDKNHYRFCFSFIPLKIYCRHDRPFVNKSKTNQTQHQSQHDKLTWSLFVRFVFVDAHVAFEPCRPCDWIFIILCIIKLEKDIDIGAHDQTMMDDCFVYLNTQHWARAHYRNSNIYIKRIYRGCVFSLLLLCFNIYWIITHLRRFNVNKVIIIMICLRLLV